MLLLAIRFYHCYMVPAVGPAEYLGRRRVALQITNPLLSPRGVLRLSVITVQHADDLRLSRGIVPARTGVLMRRVERRVNRSAEALGASGAARLYSS